MYNLFDFNKEIERNKMHNCYAFCSYDENLIKNCINKLKNKILDDKFLDLNYAEIDGNKLDSIDSIINACETLPFMSDKRMIVVYRAEFLKNDAKENKKIFKEFKEYIKNMSPQCILVIYYLFQEEKDKPNYKIKSLSKNAFVVSIDTLKGEYLKDVIKSLFNEKGKNINRSELELFVNLVSNNMDIIKNEVEKLCSYEENKNITKEDILAVVSYGKEINIFNLVDFISQKKIKEALDSLNELIFKGEVEHKILYMIQRQFTLLLKLKIGISKGKTTDELARELALNKYICKKMIQQSRSFEKAKLEKILNKCLECEERLKTSSVNLKMELELLIMETLSI